MSKKAQTFKVDTKKSIITLYTNVEEVSAEKTLIEFYLKQGFQPRFAEKKKGATVKEMRAELKGDTEALKTFEEKYKEKNGFHNACKYYSEWKKKQKSK